MPLAADYPLLNAFWTMLLFFGFVMWIWLLVIVFTDLFGRHDISGWGKAAWTIFVLFLPLLGVLCYLIAQGHHMAERKAQAIEASQAQFDSHVRAVAGGPATQISQAKQLLDDGAITQEEFDRIKSEALAGAPSAGEYAVR